MRELWRKIPVIYRWFVAGCAFVGSAYVGVTTALSDAKPLVDSGPLPLASRQEVLDQGKLIAQLSKQSQTNFDRLEQHDSFLMHRALVDDYMKWQAQYVAAQAALKKKPNDPVAKALRDIAMQQLHDTGKALGWK